MTGCIFKFPGGNQRGNLRATITGDLLPSGMARCNPNLDRAGKSSPRREEHWPADLPRGMTWCRDDNGHGGTGRHYKPIWRRTPCKIDGLRASEGRKIADFRLQSAKCGWEGVHEHIDRLHIDPVGRRRERVPGLALIRLVASIWACAPGSVVCRAARLRANFPAGGRICSGFALVSRRPRRGGIPARFGLRRGGTRRPSG
jgi:hypothetical protein